MHISPNPKQSGARVPYVRRFALRSSPVSCKNLGGYDRDRENFPSSPKEKMGVGDGVTGCMRSSSFGTLRTYFQVSEKKIKRRQKDRPVFPPSSHLPTATSFPFGSGIAVTDLTEANVRRIKKKIAGRPVKIIPKNEKKGLFFSLSRPDNSESLPPTVNRHLQAANASSLGSKLSN